MIKWENTLAKIVSRALFSEETSQIKPPYFNVKHLSLKNKNKNFIKSYDAKLWKVINLGDLRLSLPTNIHMERNLRMVKHLLTLFQLWRITLMNKKIFRSIKRLKMSIQCCQWWRIWNNLICETAKKIWDKLKVTYEGIEKVKQTSMILLLNVNELYKIKGRESIEEIVARF